MSLVRRSPSTFELASGDAWFAAPFPPPGASSMNMTENFQGESESCLPLLLLLLAQPRFSGVFVGSGVTATEAGMHVVVCTYFVYLAGCLRTRLNL